MRCSLGNGFAYWQGATTKNASKVYFDDMAQAIEHIQSVAGDNAKNIHFANGETGWPTGTFSSLQDGLRDGYVPLIRCPHRWWYQLWCRDRWYCQRRDILQAVCMRYAEMGC